MKVDIITFHNTLNYGASLQCAALSRYMTSFGHDVEVINYLPDYVMNKKSVLKEFKKAHSLRGIIKGFAYLSKAGTIRSKDKKYTDFLERNIRLTNPYHSYDDILSDVPQADLYICGSDQIWNPSLTGDSLDKAFFLNFVSEGKSRVAYGASVGELDFEKHRDELKKLTAGFKSISVREKTVSEKLSSVIGRNVNVVLDPTLLLNKDDYRSMELPCNVPSGKYLLLYNIQNSDLTISTAKKIAAEKNLEIVDISANPFQKIKGTTRMLNIGPGEFLTLYRNADYVITNSFHGTVFSIVYEKNFNSVLHTTRGGRIRDLLSSLDLSDQIISESQNDIFSDVDYASVRNKLDILKENSLYFINSCICDNVN